MDNHYEFLVEKEAMWAQMLMQVLKDNHISCTALPVHGAGMVMRTGMQEQLRIYVPAEHKLQAQEIVEALFSDGESQSEILHVE